MNDQKRAGRKAISLNSGLKGEDFELSRADINELKRRLKDSRDPTRYMIVSRLFRKAKWRLYYNVTDDVWTSDQRSGTLFKRKQAANAVRTYLKGSGELLKVFYVKGKIKNIRTRESSRRLAGLGGSERMLRHVPRRRSVKVA